jgi:parallel beta-helix repeat protein
MVRNVVNGAGLEGEAGIRIGGSGNTAIGNRVLNANTDGFELGGSGPNLFEDNVARGNGGDGFQITPPATDIELNGNVAIGNGADGFENDAADTVLRRNQASGNHRDCANDGTIALKKKNKCADGSNFNQPGTASPRHRAR